MTTYDILSVKVWSCIMKIIVFAFYILYFSQWKGEIEEFCPNTKMLLVGCKSDLRSDLATFVQLSNDLPLSYDQVKTRH